MASTTDADRPTLDAIPVASRTLGIAGLGLAVGLLPYLYLPAAAAQQPVWAWGAIDSIQATAAHVLRLDYGIASMSAGESAGPTLALLGFWARSVTTDLMGIYPAAALIGIGVAPWHLWRGTGRPEAHIGLLCIALSLVLAGPVFGVMLSRSPDGLSIRIMRRMHLLSEWLIVIVATFGIDELARWVSRKTSIVLAALIVAAVATVGWMHTQRFHTDTVHNYILDTRDPLPDDAILVGTGDHRFFGHLYAGHVQQHRPDITYVDAQMTAYDWYRRRLRDQFDRTIPAPNNGDIDLSTLIGRLRDTGRRVCITHIFHPSLADQMRWIPMGTASCLATTPPTPPLETYHRQLAWLEAARNAPPPTPPPGSWAAESLKRYAGNFDVLQRALRASGHDNESRRAGELEEAFTPRQD